MDKNPSLTLLCQVAIKLTTAMKSALLSNGPHKEKNRKGPNSTFPFFTTRVGRNPGTLTGQRASQLLVCQVTCTASVVSPRNYPGQLSRSTLSANTTLTQLIYIGSMICDFISATY